MPNQQSTPARVYVMIVAVAITTALGVATYDKTQRAAMLENPELVEKLVESEALKRLIEQEASRSLADLDWQAVLSESDELQSWVSQSVADQLDGYAASNAFHEAVISALPEQPKIDDNFSKLNQLQSKLDQYELQLTGIAAQVNDDESALAVNQMQGQLIELQQLIGNLSDEVHCSLSLANNSKSSFLLKERRTTVLRGYDLVITLGRLKKDVIATVTISAPNAERSQVDTTVVGNVTLGKPLKFSSGGDNYEGVFTYRQPRFGPDFVGFEITKIAMTPAECEQKSIVSMR